MPHGGGHAGGGYHGGGYHGGYHGGGYRGGGCSPQCSLFWITVSTIVAVLGLIIGLRVGLPAGLSSSELYAPIDNRLISYTAAFCESLSLRFAAFPGDRASSSFQLLSSEPSLTGSDSIQFQENPSFDFNINFQYWSFFLPQGSKINFEACSENSPSFEYYIIAGSQNFRSWRNDPSPDRAEIGGRVSDFCSSGTTTDVVYNVVADEEYYVVFYNPTSSSSSLDITFDIFRTLYASQPDQVITSCNVTFDSTCVVGLPLQDFSIGFLEIQTSGPFSWSSSYGVSITCNARDWIYAVIIIPVLIGILVVFAVAFTYFWFLMKKEAEKKKNKDLNKTTPAVDNKNVASTAFDYGP